MKHVIYYRSLLYKMILFDCCTIYNYLYNFFFHVYVFDAFLFPFQTAMSATRSLMCAAMENVLTHREAIVASATTASRPLLTRPCAWVSCQPQLD